MPLLKKYATYLSTLDEDDLVLTVLAVVDFVRGTEGNDGELRRAVLICGMCDATLEALLCHALEEVLIDFARELCG